MLAPRTQAVPQLPADVLCVHPHAVLWARLARHPLAHHRQPPARHPQEGPVQAAVAHGDRENPGKELAKGPMLAVDMGLGRGAEEEPLCGMGL